MPAIQHLVFETSFGAKPLAAELVAWFEDGGWAPDFSTDATLEVKDLLEAVASRWALEVYQPDCTSSAGLYQLAA